MEILVYPRGFTVLPTKIPNQQGDLVDAVTVVVLDGGGIAIKVTFTLPDWEQFQKCIADPEGFAAAAQARATILGPGGLAPTLRDRKH